MEYVVVRTFQQYFQAHITMTKLRDAGIVCFLKDEFTVTIDPILTNAIGGIKLLVRKDDENAANELLAHFDEEYRKSAVCPRCGGRNIERVPKQSTPNLFIAILTWVLGSYAISAKNVYQCSNCGYESEELSEDYFPDTPGWEENN